MLWDEGQWDPHVLISVQRRVQVEIFNVYRHVSGIRCAQDAILQDLGCDEIRCVGGQFTRIVDEITTDRDSHPIRVFFLWSIIDHDPGICNSPIGRNGSNANMIEEHDSVGALGICGGVALGESAKLLPKGARPHLLGIRILVQRPVLGDGLPCCGMDDS